MREARRHVDAFRDEPPHELAGRRVGQRAERRVERLRIAQPNRPRRRRSGGCRERSGDELRDLAHQPLLVPADAVPLEHRELGLVPAAELVVAEYAA